MSGAARPRARAADLERARVRAWLRLLKLTRLVGADLRERLRLGYGMTLPQFDVMAALDRSRTGLTMSELSDALMVSNGNVTGIVDRLVEAGLALRVPVENDRRATRVRLTQRGQESFADLARIHRGWVSEALGGLDGGDVETLVALLDGARDGRTGSNREPTP